MAEWIAASSALILAAAALRFAFRGKISPGIQYAVWALVLIRLLVPFQLFHSSLSVGNLWHSAAVPAAAESAAEGTYAAASPAAYAGTAVPAESAGGAAAALTAVWCCGMAVTASVMLYSNLSFSLRLRRTRRRVDADCPLPVYVSAFLPTPCLSWGKVYITQQAAADETVLRHVIAHEYTHYRHGDNVWSLLGCACLVLHWYNPLVWWAASLSRRDAELACDEGAIRMTGAERAEYGRTLIELTAAVGASGGLLRCATAMCAGKRGLRERVSFIARKPKNSAVTVICAVSLCLLASACAFSGEKQAAEPAAARTALVGTEAAAAAKQLKDSIRFESDDDGNIVMKYTAPQGVSAIDAAGRFADAQAGGFSYHKSLEANPGTEGELAEEFRNFTDLTLSFKMSGGGTYAGSVDALALYKKRYPNPVPGKNLTMDADAGAVAG